MTNPADIVTRLRQGWLAHQDKDARFVQVNMQEWMRCTDLTREAATEIELLRAEHDALRAERDEVRREVCGLLVACHTDPDDEKPDPNLKHVHAEIRGWDCFKENT